MKTKQILGRSGWLPIAALLFHFTALISEAAGGIPAARSSISRIEVAELIIYGKFVPGVTPPEFEIIDVLKGPKISGTRKVVMTIPPDNARFAAGSSAEECFFLGWLVEEDTIALAGNLSIWPNGYAEYKSLIDRSDPQAFRDFVSTQLAYESLGEKNIAELASQLLRDIEDPERVRTVLDFLQWRILSGPGGREGPNEGLRRQLLAAMVLKLTEPEVIDFPAAQHMLEDSSRLPSVLLLAYCLKIADQTEGRAEEFPFQQVREFAINMARNRFRDNPLVPRQLGLGTLRDWEADLRALRSITDDDLHLLRIQDTRGLLEMFNSEVPEIRAAADKVMGAIWAGDRDFQAESEVNLRSQLTSVEDKRQYWTRFYQERAHLIER